MKKVELKLCHFEHFKNVFSEWMKTFGMGHIYLEFEHTKLEYNDAQIEFNEKGRSASIKLAVEVTQPDDFVLTTQWISDLAKHEAIHLLLGDRTNRGMDRYVTQQQLLDAEEDVVRKLENLIPNHLIPQL